MNIFTTDHPFVAQPSLFDVRAYPRMSYICRVAALAAILCPLFIGVAFRAVLKLNSMEENSDPAWTEWLWEIAGFVMAFPALLVIQALGPHEMIGNALAIGGVAVDGIFWACVIVTLHRFLRRRIQRSRARGEARWF